MTDNKLPIEFTICSICKRRFEKTYLYFEQKKCLHCWTSEQDINNSMELSDIYIHGTLINVVIWLLKTKRDEKGLKKFLKSVENTQTKDKFIRKKYLELRPEHSKFNINKQKRVKVKKDRHIYKDECSYCHHPIWLNRVFSVEINCKGCGRFMFRATHPTQKLLEKMKQDRISHKLMIQKLSS